MRSSSNVRPSRRKNVHAGLVGYLWAWENAAPEIYQKHGEPFQVHDGSKITYNPYRYESFVYKDTERPYDRSSMAHLTANREVIVA